MSFLFIMLVLFLVITIIFTVIRHMVHRTIVFIIIITRVMIVFILPFRLESLSVGCGGRGDGTRRRVVILVHAYYFILVFSNVTMRR